MQKILIIAISIIFGVACNKKEVDATGFTVTTDKESYTTADTVRFTFTGNPYYLTFIRANPITSMNTAIVKPPAAFRNYRSPLH